MSTKSVAEKLLIKPGTTVWISPASRVELIEPLPEGDSYLGFIFARAPEPETVVAALREAHRRLAFEIASVVPVIR